MLTIDLLPSEPLALCSLLRLPEWENNSQKSTSTLIKIQHAPKESDLPETHSHSACRLCTGWQRQITWHCSLITLLALPAAFSFGFVWLFLNFKKVSSGGNFSLIWNLCKSCLYKPQRTAELWEVTLLLIRCTSWFGCHLLVRFALYTVRLHSGRAESQNLLWLQLWSTSWNTTTKKMGQIYVPLKPSDHLGYLWDFFPNYPL